MKYWIVPIISEWGFLVLGIFMAVTLGKYVFFNPEPIDPPMVIAMGGVIIGFLGYGFAYGAQFRLSHHKRILQKAGLWTDEEIKKKDLPKD